MKKWYFLLTLISCMAMTSRAHSHDARARSFMFTRPAHYNLAMRNAAWHNCVYSTDDTTKSAVQAIGFYKKSDILNKTRRYFLPGCSHELLVSGDAVAETFFTRDVRAEWVGLPANFNGILTISPTQTQGGGLIEYCHHLDKSFDASFFNNSWLSLSLPVVHVQNSIGIGQKNVSSSVPANITHAFSQSSWQYGKFCPTSKTATGIAELRIDLGTKFVQKRMQLGYYSFITIPTTRPQDPSFIFNPFIGNNGHLGLGSGIHMEFPISACDGTLSASFFTAMEALWLTHNRQKRTLDLYKKPWSRYLPFNRKNGTPHENIPGVNVLTVDVKVTPYGMADFSTGWRIRAKNVELELSYNVWGHAQEKVVLEESFKHTFCCQAYGIAGTGTLLEKGHIVASSASTSTICSQENDDTTFVAITEHDLDFTSGSSASAINHMLQASLAGTHIGKKFDACYAIGAYIDIPQKNSTLKTWGAWFKCGGSF